MPNYVRWRETGATYFFTVVTFDRRRFLTTDTARACLREAWLAMRDDYPFTLDAVCVLPDHLHCLWTLPEEDSNYSVRWGRLKSGFSRLYRARGGQEGLRNPSRRARGERGFWQRRFWEHRIREEKDFARHFDYIHYNPVKHGLVAWPEQWPWSTFHRYARLGWYETDWGRDPPPGLDDMTVQGE